MLNLLTTMKRVFCNTAEVKAILSVFGVAVEITDNFQLSHL